MTGPIFRLMRKKTILKNGIREKHTRARSSVAPMAVRIAKEVVAEEEPVEVAEPVIRKRTRKAQAPKVEMPVVVDESTENNE